MVNINKVIESLDTHEGYFKIYHFWNNKAERVSKKLLKDMFEAQHLEMKFTY